MIMVSYDKLRWRGKKTPLLIPQYRFAILKRYCESWKDRNLIIYYFFRLLYVHYKAKYLTDIPSSVKIGKGFRIEHLGGIVINPEVIIGDNFTLLNGVLIGSQMRGENKGTPTIGNDVWIGTNAIVVGKIKIGNNVLIAPGAYVNFDVPDDSIVIGNPARIIHNVKATEAYIINPI